MKKIIWNTATCILLVAILTQCTDDFLQKDQKGVLTDDNLGIAQIEGLVIATYAYGPRRSFGQTLNPWIFGSIRSDDAYKGGASLTDQGPWHQMEVFSLMTASVGNNSGPWYHAYIVVSRANAALRALNKVDENEFPLRQQRIAEMKFMRAYWHLKIKRNWRWVPYITEEMTPDDIKLIPNRPEGATSCLPVWQSIADDLKAAADILPEVQAEVGRPTKYAAKAFLAHVLMWMAYEQNELHQVVNINNARLEEALNYCNEIINSGRYALAPDFGHNFMPEFDNQTTESIWDIQHSKDDGTAFGNLNWGDYLNTPRWEPYYRCCDFHKATFNLVHAFRTSEGGVPLFDTYNNVNILHGSDFDLVLWNANTWDPRISHTIGIPDHPWKYVPDLLYSKTGSRMPTLYGYFHSLKEQVNPLSPFQFQNRGNSMNKTEIRYAEVLLWKAEILIKLNREMEALPLINLVRQRAAESTGMLKFSNGEPPMNYHVEPYIDGVNCNWDNVFAWGALVWETRLETALEGRRFFNLIRWGIAEQVMNSYFDVEQTRFGWLSSGRFQSGVHEYLPIPQVQINWSEGVYSQNPGY